MMINFKPGFLLLDKEVGISSAKALYPVKKLVPKGVKVGHAGTLDPFASGLLVVGLGREATKLLSQIVGMDKIYDFTIHWGIETKTDDLTGEIINQTDLIPSRYNIEKAIPNFIGLIEQVPPLFSAINLQGKRAYDLARNNIIFELKARQVKVDELYIIGEDKHQTSFRMRTGKGCYVRSIARDLARTLGSYGHVSQLRRVSIGQFDVATAIVKPDSLKNIITIDQINF